MAKNLVHCMSPVTIGLKVDPSYPARNASTTHVNGGTFRTDAGVRTVESGDLVRLGDLFGVVTVDHQDKLAGFDSSPVINFGLNVWKVKVRLARATTNANPVPKGAMVQYVEGAGVDVDKGRLFYVDRADTAVTRSASGDMHATDAITHYQRVGVLMEAITGTNAQDVELEVDVLIGAIGATAGAAIVA